VNNRRGRSAINWATCTEFVESSRRRRGDKLMKSNYGSSRSVPIRAAGLVVQTRRMHRMRLRDQLTTQLNEISSPSRKPTGQRINVWQRRTSDTEYCWASLCKVSLCLIDWSTTTKPSLEVAPIALATLLADREFSAGCYLFTVSILLFDHVGQPAHTTAYLAFPVSLSFLAEKGTFPPATLNFNLWPWPTNVIQICSRWTVTPDVCLRGHFVWQ